ncbi:winged helix DNA-binding domain-containing protein [Nocardioides pantholopis]|uniref:winged helix DNA-binding domain-containing protein n=1 Tax=Nocardioides pantholopis TaxID=2483798 RepID=UPI000FD96002|nr:winged helix DNA-binding domain-containing protein [Nocardioides pantholopis]
MRTISDDERRARLAVRHGLAGGLPTVEDATAAMTALHATEAATVHLALWARVPGVTVADVDAALYDGRTVVKQLAMRRTLFAFPRDLLPAAWGSAAARVAAQLRARLVKDVVAGGLATDPERWLAAAADAVLKRLADGSAPTTAQLREELPALQGRVSRGTPGKAWAAEVPIAPSVLWLLGAEARVLRGINAGHWRLNKPTWVRTDHWLGAVPEPWPEAEGYAELVGRWLHTFGPGTEADLVWWLGATKTAVRRALAAAGAVQVGLEDGGTGWVLPDDLEPVAPVRPWAALLPTLDPTVMGWQERGFYLDAADRPRLFDTNGNAGNTAWWDGRIVGSWLQDDAGVVRVLPCREVGAAGRTALEAEAKRLTAWLDGVRITNVYASPQMRGAALP